MNKAEKIAFDLFHSMKVYDVINISDHAPNKPDLFIQKAKEYIDNGGNIEFSNDYKRIRKLNEIPPIK